VETPPTGLGVVCPAGVGLVQEPEHERRREQQRGAGAGVQEELRRRVLPVLRTPSEDEEVHRDEHELPEHEERDEVQREEDPHDRGLEQQEPERVRLHAVLDAARRGEQTDREEHRGRHDHEEAEAVDTDDVADAERVDPPVRLEELEPAVPGLEVLEDQAVGEHDE